MASRKKVSATADRHQQFKLFLYLLISLTFFAYFPAVSSAALRIFELIPNEESQKFSNTFTIINAVIAALGFASAIYFFFKSARTSQLQQKKQHTITILFESRLSPELREANEVRKAIFPPGRKITPEDFFAAYRREKSRPHWSVEKIEARNKGAEALVTMLNYYEFLALGIRKEDLDSELLEGSIRGIMCSLVHDARFVVSDLRRQNPKTYQNLAWLYAEWHEKGSPHELPIPE